MVDINDCRVVDPSKDPDSPISPVEALQDAEAWALESFTSFVLASPTGRQWAQEWQQEISNESME